MKLNMYEETDNPDGSCDDCKFWIITDKEILQVFGKWDDMKYVKQYYGGLMTKYNHLIGSFLFHDHRWNAQYVVLNAVPLKYVSPVISDGLGEK